MHREIVCPGCGQVIPLDAPDPRADRPPPGDAAMVDAPRAACEVDHPDSPDLASVAEGKSALIDASPIDSAHDALPSPTAEPSGSVPSESSSTAVAQDGASDPFLAALVPAISSDDSETLLDGSQLADDESLPNLELHSSETSVQPPGTAFKPEASADREVGATSEVEPARPGPSLGFTLLASYASAVTIGLAWLLWTGWGRHDASGPTLPESSRIELLGEDGASLLKRLPRLPNGRRTPLGRSLRVGQLEITPLSVRSDRVRLSSTTSPGRRDGGAGALHLRLKIRNSSNDSPITPIDPAFVREPDHGAPESLIVAGDHVILPYPLAVQSDWSIRGQDFSPLDPGEEREYLIVSEPEALGKIAPEMSWRLRLRTSKDETGSIEVDFNKGDIGPS